MSRNFQSEVTMGEIFECVLEKMYRLHSITPVEIEHFVKVEIVRLFVPSRHVFDILFGAHIFERGAKCRLLSNL